MKAYKAYLKKHYDTHQGDMHYNPSCEQGFQAALKWLLSDTGPLGYYNNNCDFARTMVKNELNDD